MFDVKKFISEYSNEYVDPLWKIPADKIVIDFSNTDIRNVFRLLGEAADVRFELSSDVTGRIVLSILDPTPIREVVAEILKHEQLVMTERDGIFRIEKRGSDG